MKWYTNVLLIAFLITNDMQHLSVCIFTILYIFFGEVYLQIFCTYSTSCFLVTEW